MTRFEIIVIVLLAVNGFWGFCIMGLLNSLNNKIDILNFTMAERAERNNK